MFIEAAAACPEEGAMKNCWVWRCVRINFANLHNGTCRSSRARFFYEEKKFFTLVFSHAPAAIIMTGRVEIIR